MGRINLTNRQLKVWVARKPKVKTPPSPAGLGSPLPSPLCPSPQGAAGGGGPLGTRRLLAASPPLARAPAPARAPLRGPRFLSGSVTGSRPQLRRGFGGGPVQTLLLVTRTFGPRPAVGQLPQKKKCSAGLRCKTRRGDPVKLLRAPEDGLNAPEMRWEVCAPRGREGWFGCGGREALRWGGRL